VDSISQFALGATIGEPTLGKSLGRRAMLFGGLLGTLPDMDVLVRYADAVAGFTYHRSWSHSLFVLALASPVIAWLFFRAVPKRWLVKEYHPHAQADSLTYLRWLFFVFLVLLSHPVLDAFTVYGTQIFWPLRVNPVAWGSLFIIDPLYTLPLLISLVVAYRCRSRAGTAALVGLAISTGYIALSLASQQHARAIALASLERQNLAADNVLVAPAPLSVLWRIVSMDGDKYHEGFYSLFDQEVDMRFATYDSHRDIIDENLDHWPVARLDWFTNGFIAADSKNDQLIINDLRMGVESSYVFRFRVGRWANSAFQADQSVLMPVEMNTERLRQILHRAWDERIDVLPFQ